MVPPTSPEVPTRPDRELTVPPGRNSTVGRDRELSSLAAFLDGVGSGFGALVIDGEPGVGKTHLLRWGVAEARDRGFTVLQGRPSPREADLPYASLVDLLGPVVDDTLPELAPPQRRALEAALLRTDLAAPSCEDRALPMAVLAVLRSVAGTGPTLVAVDDLQWLDPPTALVLEFAFRRLDDLPVRVVAAATGPPGGEPPVDPSTLGPRERLHHLRLGPLDADSLASLLRSRLPNPLPHPALRWVDRATGGNPRLALEVAEALLAEGWTPGPDGLLPVPAPLGRAAGKEVRALSPAGRRAVLAAWALREPTPGPVGAVSAAWGKKGRGLEEAVRSGILAVRGDRVVLARPLVAAVAYAEASPRARQVLHGRLARVVDPPEDRVRHLGLSARSPDPAVAALLDRAAAGAHRDGPAGLAAELADLAVRLTPPEDRDRAVRRRVAAAGYHLDVGDAPGARALVEAALAGGGPERLRGDLHRLLGVARWHDGAGSPEEPLERALQEAGEDDALRAAVLRDLAWAGLRGGRLAEGSARARAALRLAERVGDRGLVAEAAAAFALLEAVQGRGGHRWDLEAGTEHGSRPERPGIHSHPAAVLGVILKWEDRFEAARRWLEAAHEEARRRGDLGCLPFLLHHLCELECWAGDLSRAARWAAAQQEAVARAGQEGFRPAALHAGALVDAYRGRAEAARGAATEGAALAERADDRFALMQNLAVLGFLELSAGRPAAARRHLATVTDLAAAAGVGEPGAIRFQADAVEALVELERLDEAERLLGRLEQQATALDRPWALATSARCRGLLRAAQGDHEGALESLRSAVQAHRRLPHPLELGRTMLATGSVQRRCRHRQSARTSLAAALRTFEAVGAGLWSERVRSELDRNGLGRRLLNGLTPTEHRVSELVLEGRTNREIARALFMGQKTVETHLSSIYRKLGVRSRLELARSLSSGAQSQGEP